LIHNGYRPDKAKITCDFEIVPPLCVEYWKDQFNQVFENVESDLLEAKA